MLLALPSEIHGGRWGVMGPAKLCWANLTLRDGNTRVMGTTPGAFRRMLESPTMREPHRHALPYSPG